MVALVREPNPEGAMIKRDRRSLLIRSSRRLYLSIPGATVICAFSILSNKPSTIGVIRKDIYVK